MKISILTPLFCNEIGLRSNNEDTIYPAPYMATTSDRLFLVCDGMEDTKMERLPVKLWLRPYPIIGGYITMSLMDGIS